ncbi:MAG: UDP-3-O-(3-hydroxymyristoyl)glucosamine N-acyltransferase [Planctomycetes bacterium]|nr:UDP-3-O-(3-hydroxymyristoyl)glucosamine N-acyltransferase [Planctomycetota bacterium]
MTKTLAEIAELTGATLEGDPSREIDAVRPLDDVDERSLAFLSDELRPAPNLDESRAGGLIVEPGFDRSRCPEQVALLRVANPKLAWAMVIEFLHPARPVHFRGVSEQAVIDPSAKLGRDVTVAPFCTIGPDCVLGDRVVLYPGCHLGPDVSVGDDTVLHANVVVYWGARIGRRCTVYAGTTVASDGFGWAIGPTGATKVPHRGGCVIEDDCEIAANCAIDRGALDDTVIRQGTKLDNLVHVAHNCRIGPHALLAAQVGMAGSTTIGMGVQMGGQSGLNGHIEIGAGSMIGARTGVHADLAPRSRVLGSPAMDQRLAGRVFAIMPRLPDMRTTLLALEKRIAELEMRLSKEKEI